MKQLSALDAMFLYMETPYSYGHVASTSIYERPYPGYDAYQTLRSTVEARLGVLEPLRRRLVKDPFDLDLPHWVIDPDFDIDFHIRHIGLPPPGDMSQLQAQVARLAGRPLDLGRPLWEAYIIDGLPDDRFALFMKMHHATVDGAAGAELLGMITDDSPGAERPELIVPLAPAGRLPSTSDLLRTGLFGLATQPLKLVRFQAKLIRGLAESGRTNGLKPLVDVFGKLIPGQAGNVVRNWAHDEDGVNAPAVAAPQMSFNASIGPHRRFEARSVDLDRIKTLKSATGATVNDVVMAVCAGAMRTWLEEKGELPGVPLVSMIPVSVRTGNETDRWTNRVSAIFADIPTDQADPLTRLAKVNQAMTAGKEQFELLPADILVELSQAAPHALSIRASRMVSRLRIGGRMSMPFNLVISNVPGPRQPLYLGEAKLQHYYPVSTVVEGQGLNITVQSYLNTLDFGLVSCSDLVPDLDRLADLIVHEVDVLEKAVAAMAAPAKKKAAPRKKAPAKKKAAPRKKAAARKKAAPRKKAPAKKS